jgi:hypothetical protein
MTKLRRRKVQAHRQKLLTRMRRRMEKIAKYIEHYQAALDGRLEGEKLSNTDWNNMNVNVDRELRFCVGTIDWYEKKHKPAHKS